jgi:hypothetical protein
MRKKLYLAIVKRLQQLIIRDGKIIFITEEELQRMKDDNEPIEYAIKHFDLWNQNVDFMELEQPSFFPLCFIEFLPIRWQHLSGGNRMANIAIQLHVVDQWLYPTHSGSDFQEQGLQYLDLLDSINEALHQFSGEGFGSFSNTDSITNHNHEGIIESIEAYITCTKDESAVEVPRKVPAPEPKFNLKKC